MTPGAVAYRAGLSVDAATVVQYIAMAATVAVTILAWLRRDAATGFIVGVVASQLLSPLLWDHYAMLLLLPTGPPAGAPSLVGGRDPAPPMAPSRPCIPAGIRRRTPRSSSCGSEPLLIS